MVCLVVLPCSGEAQVCAFAPMAVVYFWHRVPFAEVVLEAFSRCVCVHAKFTSDDSSGCGAVWIVAFSCVSSESGFALVCLRTEETRMDHLRCVVCAGSLLLLAVNIKWMLI